MGRYSQFFAPQPAPAAPAPGRYRRFFIPGGLPTEEMPEPEERRPVDYLERALAGALSGPASMIGMERQLARLLPGPLEDAAMAGVVAPKEAALRAAGRFIPGLLPEVQAAEREEFRSKAGPDSPVLDALIDTGAEVAGLFMDPLSVIGPSAAAGKVTGRWSRFFTGAADEAVDAADNVAGDLARVADDVTAELPLRGPLDDAPAFQRGEPLQTPEYQFNADRLDLPASVAQEIPDVLGSQEDAVRRARRGVQAWSKFDDMPGLSDRVGMSEQDFLDLKPGTALSDDQHGVMSAFVSAEGRRMSQLRKEIAEAPSAEKLAELDAVEGRYVRLLINDLAAGSESGRALNALKRMKAALDTPEAIRRHIMRTSRGKLGEEDVRLLAQIDVENPEELRTFLLRLNKPKWHEYPRELFYQSVLSGVDTHARNVVGTGMHMAAQVPVRFLGALIDAPLSKLTGKPRQRYLSEVLPFVYGTLDGLKDGAVRAVEVLRRGPDLEGAQKWTMAAETGEGAFDEALAVLGESLPSSPLRRRAALSVAEARNAGPVRRGVARAGQVAADVLTLPSRLLVAEDAVWKGIARGAELRALAVRQAAKEGLDGDALATRVSQLLSDPPEAILAAAKTFEEQATFTDEASRAGQLIMRSRGVLDGTPLEGAYKVLHTTILPFVRTPDRLLVRGLEFTPAGLLMKKGAAKDPDALARAALGSGVMAYVWSLGMEGRLVGAPPNNPAERDAFYRAGKKPYSVRVGDNYYQFTQIEPLAAPLALATAAFEAVQNGDEQGATVAVTRAMLGLAQNQLERSYLDSLANALTALRGGADRSEATLRMLGRPLAAMAVPYSGLLSGVGEAMDPGIKESEGLGDLIQAQVPGLRETVPNRIDSWGRDIMGDPRRGFLPGGTPFLPSPAVEDPVDAALAAAGVSVGLPRPVIDGVEISDPARAREYQRLAGNLQRTELERLTQSPSFRRASPEVQKRLIDRVVRRSRERAQALYRRRKRGER